MYKLAITYHDDEVIIRTLVRKLGRTMLDNILPCSSLSWKKEVITIAHIFFSFLSFLRFEHRLFEDPCKTHDGVSLSVGLSVGLCADDSVNRIIAAFWS